MMSLYIVERVKKRVGELQIFLNNRANNKTAPPKEQCDGPVQHTSTTKDIETALRKTNLSHHVEGGSQDLNSYTDSSGICVSDLA